jgi:hypothetical protein
MVGVGTGGSSRPNRDSSTDSRLREYRPFGVDFAILQNCCQGPLPQAG